MLHGLHVFCVFERKSAGVKGNPLANQTDGLAAAAFIHEFDKSRLLVAPAGDTKECFHAQCFHFFGAKHLTTHAGLTFGDLFCDLRKVRRRRKRWRFIDQIAGKNNGLTDRFSTRYPCCYCVEFRWSGKNRDVFNILFFLPALLAFVFGEGIRPEHHSLHDRLTGQVFRQRNGHGFCRHADGSTANSRRGRLNIDNRSLLLIPKAHEEHPFSSNLPVRMDKEKIPLLRLKILCRRHFRKHPTHRPIHLLGLFGKNNSLFLSLL